MTNHACVYACVVLLFVQKWYLPALLAIVSYFIDQLCHLKGIFNGQIVYHIA